MSTVNPLPSEDSLTDELWNYQDHPQSNHDIDSHYHNDPHRLVYLNEEEKRYRAFGYDVSEHWGSEHQSQERITAEDHSMPRKPEQKEEPPINPDHAWSKRVHVGIDRSSKVGIDVKVLPQVRKDIIALSVAHGMAAQRYVERLIVDAINNNLPLVEQGGQYIKRAKGNVRYATALAQNEKLASPEIDTHIPADPSRSR